MFRIAMILNVIIIEKIECPFSIIVIIPWLYLVKDLFNMQLTTKAGGHSEVYNFKQKHIRYKKIALVLFKESVK